MGHVGFITARRHWSSGVPSGLFHSASALEDNADVPLADRRALDDIMVWFKVNLPVPDSFTVHEDQWRTKGISWFRDSASEHISRMRGMAAILERNDVPTQMITAKVVGRIIYQDEFQVVAMPDDGTRIEWGQ